MLLRGVSAHIALALISGFYRLASMQLMAVTNVVPVEVAVSHSCQHLPMYMVRALVHTCFDCTAAKEYIDFNRTCVPPRRKHWVPQHWVPVVRLAMWL
jgi:hypothetical protein